MIVEIYNEEELTAPFIGVDVQMPQRTTTDKGNFTNCLTKKIIDYVRDNSKNSENSENDAEDRHSSQVIASASGILDEGLNLIGGFAEIKSNFSLSQLFFQKSVHNNRFDTFIVALPAMTNN